MVCMLAVSTRPNELCFCMQMGVDATVLYACGKDNFRKPGTGMWDFFVENLNGGVSPGTSQSLAFTLIQCILDVKSHAMVLLAIFDSKCIASQIRPSAFLWEMQQAGQQTSRVVQIAISTLLILPCSELRPYLEFATL